MKLRKYTKHDGGDMNNDQKIVRLETIIENIHETLQRFDRRFDSIDTRLQSLDDKISKEANRLDAKISRIESRLWTNFLWIMSAFAGLFAIIARSLHWF